jgi:hypothetical protein
MTEFVIILWAFFSSWLLCQRSFRYVSNVSEPSHSSCHANGERDVTLPNPLYYSHTVSRVDLHMHTQNIGVPIALLKEQVAPESCRKLCESLNDRLAFDFEITDTTPKLMKDNIEEYLVKRG